MRPAIIITIILLCPVAFAATIHVPDDYATIQAAIDASANGDTVLVASGIYVENIDFKGKKITVASESGPDVTIIDGNQTGSVVTIIDSDSGQVLDGFTITNGSNLVGGGIYCDKSSPTIINNLITGNTANDPSMSGKGGGIHCSASEARIICNIISNNTAEKNSIWACDGGGIYCIDSSPIIANNIIVDNKTPDRGGGICCFGYGSGKYIANNIIADNEASDGGGIYFSWVNGFIENNTIAGNMADRGGGVEVYFFTTMTFTNLILWDNDAAEGPEIYLAKSVSYPSPKTSEG